MALLIPSLGRVLLHVPKTGGTYATQAAMQARRCWDLAMPGVSRRHQLPQHLDARPDACPGWRYATFVRYPVDWYTSWYRFQRRAGWKTWEPGAWHPLNVTNECRADTFSEFVENMARELPGFLTALFHAYEDHPRVDFVGKLEYVDRCLEYLLHVPEVPHVEASRRNASRGTVEVSLRDVYTIEQSERLAIERYYPETITQRTGGAPPSCWFTRQSSGLLEAGCSVRDLRQYRRA